MRTSTNRTDAKDSPSLLKRPWFWAAVALGLYTLIGAVVVPIVAKNWIVDFVRQSYGRRLEIGSLRTNPFTFSATVSDVVLYETNADTFLTCKEFTVNLSVLPLLRHGITVSEVEITDPFVAIRMRADSSMNFDDLLISSGQQGGGGEPWDVLLESLTINGAAVSFWDETVEPVADFRVVDGAVRVSNLHLDSPDTATVAFSCSFGRGGDARMGGVFVPADPYASLSVQVNSMALVPSQPYLSRYAHLDITSGALSVDGTVQASAPQAGTPEVSFRGDVTVTSLNLVDHLKRQRFLAWDSLSVSDIEAHAQPLKVRAQEVRIANVYMRLEIAADQTLNAKDVLEPVLSRPAASGAQPSPPPDIYIGRVVLASGAAYFADYSLPLPFATNIHSLTGTVAEIVPNNPTGASVMARGAIDVSGLAKVDGGFDPFDPMAYTDLNVVLTNVEMTRLTPYSGKFAGYRIDRGKMSLDLKYEIHNSRLVGKNQLLLEKLTLGEKIESEDATSLPVKLAVALLKDANGNIDLDMEVAGDLNDPQVNTASLVWQALTKVLWSIVRAPFHFLATLLGIEGEELEYIQFEPGKADLTPPQHERLANLTMALNKRPALLLGIHGTYDVVTDARAAREQKFEIVLQDKMSHNAGLKPDSASPTGADRLLRESLEELYIDEFTGEELQRLEAKSTSAATDSTMPSLDVRAYLKAVRTALVNRQPVQPEELQALADRRAQAIRTDLLTACGLPESRVTMGEREELKSENDEWVRSRLSLDALEIVADSTVVGQDSVKAGR